MKKISDYIDKFNSFWGKLASWLVLLLTLLTFQQVTARYLFNSSSIALQELEWHLFGCIFLLSIAHTLKNDEHVRVDLFYSKLSAKAKAWIDSIGIITMLLPISYLMIYHGYDFVKLALSYENSRPSNYYSSSIAMDSFAYPYFAAIESFFREYVLLGEISPDPGGLEARWLIKAFIPFSFCLLFMQGISQLIKNFTTILTTAKP